MVSNVKKEKSSKHHKQRSPSGDERSPSPTPNKKSATREGAEQMSLSIEETNKLRASLGLKPLSIDSGEASGGDQSTKSLNSDENFVHQPAIDITEKKRAEKLIEKLNLQKEKRLLQEKFLSKATLASDVEESASNWIEKTRLAEEEKRKAAQRAKQLEQLDEDLSTGNVFEDKRVKTKPKRYSQKDLAGLRIEHSIDQFKEGQQVILTLKDRKILGNSGKDGDDDDDDEDVLINANIADNELAKERAELGKRKKPGYRAYNDDESAEQFGMFNPNRLLEQYDDKKKSSFRLESDGSYDMSDEKVIDNMKQEIRARMQSLAMPEPKIASEFYTAAEMEQFKKPKKVTKNKLRSRKMLKADDLLAIDNSEHQGESSSTASVSLRPAETRRPTAIASTSKERPTNVSLSKLKKELIITTAPDDDDLVGPDDDLSKITVDDDAFDELQAVVKKTMRLKNKAAGTTTEKLLAEVVEEREKKLKLEVKSEPMEVGIIVPTVPTPAVDDKSLVLDTMSEFCRNVGETTSDAASVLPTLRVAKKLKRNNVHTSKKSNKQNKEALDADDELLQHALENDDFDADAMDDTPAEDINTKPFRLEDTLLSDEANLDRGIASALKLAMQKGYIEQEKTRRNARPVRDISVKNYTIEQKSSHDIDDKHARRDRYASGPLTDFKEKEHYKPEVKLEYVDETGRQMNEKEAFRYLSHRFHGKGSGKKKTEKRMKKLAEEDTMKKMSSVDTPLQTYVMSHPIAVPPVHETSPPPFDDDFGDIDNEPDSNPTLNYPYDPMNETSDDWKSADEDQDLPVEKLPDKSLVIEEQLDGVQQESFAKETATDNDFGWANFASFDGPDQNPTENSIAQTSRAFEENPDDDWAQFESTPTPAARIEELPVPTNESSAASTISVPVPLPNVADDDDFGEFSEVQVAEEPPSTSVPIDTFTDEQIDSLMSTCFPLDVSSSTDENDSNTYSALPSFSSIKAGSHAPSFLDSSIDLWKTLANLSNDPLGITFQWRKSNTEHLFHRALNVSERYKMKSVPLTPEILQPEKVKSQSTSNTKPAENGDDGTKLPSPTLRPHFDWKQSGLKNPLSDNDSVSVTSASSKTEENVFDANKTLDLDFYVSPIRPPTEDDRRSSSSGLSNNENQLITAQRSTAPIKTVDLYPGSTTAPLNEDTKKILDSLPNLSFMSAKALMFPVRFNGATQNESNSPF